MLLLQINYESTPYLLNANALVENLDNQMKIIKKYHCPSYRLSFLN